MAQETAAVNDDASAVDQIVENDRASASSLPEAVESPPSNGKDVEEEILEEEIPNHILELAEVVEVVDFDFEDTEGWEYRAAGGLPVNAIQLTFDESEKSISYVKWGGEQTAKFGDWLVHNPTGGDTYTVDNESFYNTYMAVADTFGLYQKKGAWCKRVPFNAAPFTIPTKEGGTQVNPGDWLMANNVDLSDKYAMRHEKWLKLYGDDTRYEEEVKFAGAVRIIDAIAKNELLEFQSIQNSEIEGAGPTVMYRELGDSGEAVTLTVENLSEFRGFVSFQQNDQCARLGIPKIIHRNAAATFSVFFIDDVSMPAIVQKCDENTVERAKQAYGLLILLPNNGRPVQTDADVKIATIDEFLQSYMTREDLPLESSMRPYYKHPRGALASMSNAGPHQVLIDPASGQSALTLIFQNGPVANGQNGIFVEDLIAASRERLRILDDRATCAENETAIGLLTTALKVLWGRTHRMEEEKAAAGQ